MTTPVEGQAGHTNHGRKPFVPSSGSVNMIMIPTLRLKCPVLGRALDRQSLYIKESVAQCPDCVMYMVSVAV